MVYRFKEAARLSHLDAQKCGERLEALKQKHGELTAELVLEDAQKPSSPLHSAFEWSNAAAAHQHRLTQARYILRQIVVVEVIESPKTTTVIRGFVPVNSTVTPGKKMFVGITEAMSDIDMRKQVLKRALKELQQWKARYQTFKEFAKIFEAMDAVNMED